MTAVVWVLSSVLGLSLYCKIKKHPAMQRPGVGAFAGKRTAVAEALRGGTALPYLRSVLSSTVADRGLEQVRWEGDLTDDTGICLLF